MAGIEQRQGMRKGPPRRAAARAERFFSAKQVFSRKNFSYGATASIVTDGLWNPFGLKVVVAAQGAEIDTASGRKLSH
jgi:hypothetical protein